MKNACIFSILVPVLLLVITTGAGARSYRPVISGKMENGNRLYTEVLAAEEEFVDSYYYNQIWLRYRQKLDTSDYYYLKAQYYRKEYEEQTTYDNISLDLWGNYTFRLSDKLRNRWELNIKNKDYLVNWDKTYNSYKLKYELTFDLNPRNRYVVYLQRQWNDYRRVKTNNSVQDRFSLKWSYEFNDRLDIDTTYQVERELFNRGSDRTNKYGNKVSLGFQYEL